MGYQLAGWQEGRQRVRFFLVQEVLVLRNLLEVREELGQLGELQSVNKTETG